MPAKNKSSSRSDGDALKNALNACLAIYRRNVSTPRDEAAFILYGLMHATISRQDFPEWEAQIRIASAIPPLHLASRDNLQKVIVQAVAELPADAKGFSRGATHEFLKQFDRMATAYTVRRPVWGLHCGANSEPLQLGSVTLYNRDTHEPESPVAAMAQLASLQHAGSVPNVWAVVAVTAFDEVRAIEMAGIVFEQLEAVLNVLLPARGSERQISILSPNISMIGPCHVESGAGVHLAFKTHGPIENISINDDWFRNPSAAFTRLVALVGSTPVNSPLANDVLYAAQWCAKSRTTDDPTTAFIQAAVAMEVLLGKSDSRGGGISGRMAVNAAHLLGETTQDCEEVADFVKHCYGLRSKGVHGHSGPDPRLISALPRWQHIVTQLIIKVLEASEEAGINTVDDLAKTLEARTYAYKGVGAEREPSQTV
jgi:hypothetical protein